MLQQIDDEGHTKKYDMWQQSTYKPIFEEFQDMLRQRGTIEDLHHQMKKIRFEGYNKKKKMKQFRGYKIWKKSRRKVNVFEVKFLNCKPS